MRYLRIDSNHRKQMDSTEINYRGVSLVVGYDFEPGESETNDCPGCADSVSIIDVLTESGDDIFDLFDNNMTSEIEQLVIQSHLDELESLQPDEDCYE